ncbi:MAG TPA: glycosyltransferase [Longimicrobiales bacterium]
MRQTPVCAIDNGRSYRADEAPAPVLYLDNSSTFGGAINSLLYMLKELDRQRYRPILVSGQQAEFVHEQAADVEYHEFEPKQPWRHDHIYTRIQAFPLFRWRPAARLLSWCRYAFWMLFITLPEALRYYRIGRRHRVALVHLNNCIESQFAGMLAARLLRVPCVAHSRGFQPVDRVVAASAKLVHHHIAISSAIRDNLRELNIAADRISVIFDGVDLSAFDAHAPSARREAFGIPADAKVFGIFGRIVDWKGIREFVLAAARVFEAEPSARAMIVGDRSDGEEAYYNAIIGLIAERGLEDRIILTGYRADVPALMRLMDVVVHASTEPEPFGMVLIEAMATGKPVVATRAGGPLDIVIDGETGLLVEPKATEPMADAILRLLRDPEFAAALGRAGRVRAAEVFSNRRYAREVEAVYDRVLSDSAGRATRAAASPRRRRGAPTEPATTGR